MSFLQTINIATHVIAGGILLLLGLIPMMSKKGADKHKRYGRIYVYLYAIVLVTAVIGVVFFRSPPALMMITFAAIYSYVSGLRALSIKSCGPRLFDNLFSVVTIVAGCLMLTIMSNNATASWSPVMGYSIIGVTCSYAFYDLSRHFWVKLWTDKIWPIDHGVKMIGGYFALVSAASGNLIRDFQPWSQIAPSIIGSLISILFVYLYLSKRLKLADDLQ